MVKAFNPEAQSETQTKARPEWMQLQQVEISRPQDRTGIRLLGTSDLHMHLTAWDYVRDTPAPAGGLTRLAALIETARAEAAHAGRHVILLDNGDGLQGLGLEPVAGQPHPLMAAFRALDYDAIGLGNHDFDRGLPALAEVLEDAPCPVICANLQRLQPDLLTRVTASTVLARPLEGRDAPPRIGVLSVLPPRTMVWNDERLTGAVEIADMVETVRKEAGALRRNSCDVVVLLAHSGLGEAEHVEGQENALIPLAREAGVDAIIGGHSHLPFAGSLSGCPVAIPAPHGRHLVQIDLDLMQTAAGWAVSTSEATLRAAEEPVPANAGLARDLTNVLAGAHDATRARLARPLAQTPRRLHSFFSLLHPDPLSWLIAEAQVACARPLLAGTEAEGLSLISAAAPGRAGGRSGPGNFTDVPAGPLLARHLEDMVSFDNQVRVVVVRAAQLLDWMEMVSGVFRQLPPGEAGGVLLDPDRPGHWFDAFFGLDYQIDLSQPARFGADGRLVNPDAQRVRLRQVLEPVYAVVTTDYRVNGGGNVQVLGEVGDLALAAGSLREAVATCLRQPPPPSFAPVPWRFRPLGATARFQTAPQASDLLDEVRDFHPRPTGLDPAGFLGLDITI